MFTSIPMIFRIVNICRSIVSVIHLKQNLQLFGFASADFSCVIVYMLLTYHLKILLLYIRCLIGKAHLFTYIYNSWNKTTVGMLISFKLV